MKHIIAVVVILVVCIGVLVGVMQVRRRAPEPVDRMAEMVPAPTAPDEIPPAEECVAGELLVQFKESVTEEQATQLITKSGATVKERIDPQRIYVLSFKEEASPKELVTRFRAYPEVAVAEPNGIYEAFQDAPVWTPANADDSPRGGLGAGAPVRVAVIDTAIDSTHPELADRMVEGYNFANNSRDTQSRGTGQDWHGTAVSGRVLDGAGDANVELMPLQVFGGSGGASWRNIIKAINHAVDNGCHVINLSLGGYYPSRFVQQAIDRATAAGVVVVAAAGNTPWERPAYPAGYRGVISVAATNEAGRKASFSAYGNWVDVSAPGDTMRVLNHGGGYRMARGTSFSAPFIAGLAAMLKSAFPELTGSQIEQVIKEKARDVDKLNPRYRGKLGSGFLSGLDVKRWMREIRSGTFKFPWQEDDEGPQRDTEQLRKGRLRRYLRYFLQRPRRRRTTKGTDP